MSNPGKIYIDCTFSASVVIPRGIPRVVKKFAIGMRRLDEDIKSVIVENGQLFEFQFSECSQNKVENKHSVQLINYLRRLYSTGSSFICAVIPLPSIYRFFHNGKSDPGFTWLVYHLFIRPIRKLKGLNLFCSHGDSGDLFSLDVARGDVIFFPDAIWECHSFNSLNELKHKGVKLVWYCHDLIPITHPHFCRSNAVQFKSWVDKCLPLFDHIITNSFFTKKIVSEYCELMGFNKEVKLDVVHLGADFDDGGLSGLPHTSADYFLTVGAIDSRKNHQLILDAARLAWDAGCQFKLVWVGKVSLEMQSFIDSVVNDKHYTGLISVLGEVSDADLSQLYRNASALIFASWIEGFGLPLIEAYHSNIPVLASDIEIHREVAGNFAYFFDPSSVLSLARLINDFINNIEQYQKTESNSIAVPTWDEVCNELSSVLKGDL